MKAKYRVLQQGSSYVVQQRILWIFWFTIHVGYFGSFPSIEKAEDMIKTLIKADIRRVINHYDKNGATIDK